MKKEFVINRQGKDFVLFAGLLDEATSRGLTGIVTEVVTVTATLAVFKATATFSDERRFTAHGDATPENVGRNIAPHFIRMAETRAKARALRDALNIGAASLEELGDDDAPQAPHPSRPPAAPPVRPAPQAPEEGAPGDDVDDLTGLELVEACERMRRRLNAAGVDFAPLPEPRTNNALRHWWKLGAAALAGRP